MPTDRTNPANIPAAWSPRPRLRAWIIVALAALIMGLPTLRGSFVGGDDHRLVLNHVLVNHPSFEHAVELFRIVHRDLYQPLPLLTFSGEFVIADWLGLFNAGVEHGAWLFHLTNMLLHALNTALVWMLLRRMVSNVAQPLAENVAPPLVGGADHWVPTLAALLFAIHPLQVETVAWVNGRMMLMSTAFLLGALLIFDRWLETGRLRLVFWIALLALLSSISKVRAPLPLLVGLLALARGHRWGARFWSAWIIVAGIVGTFVWINVGATSEADLFTEGAEHLRGPRAVRILLALAFYFQHFVWPTRLTSYYPTPPLVSWSDPATIHAVAVVLFSLGLLIRLARRHRACFWGALWFFLGIADTLPFFPARNVLAADRYMYLPIIGLTWCVTHVLAQAYTRWRAAARITAAILGAGVVVVLIATSWHTAKWYDSPLLKTLRVAECFPDEPRVWENVGWSWVQLGEYENAIECAKKELRHDRPNIRSAAHQLMGVANVRLGRTEVGLQLLHQALEIDPTDDLGRFRLAAAYDDVCRIDEALPHFEAAAAAAPRNNPTLYRLAGVYRKLKRNDDARRTYEQELRNNPYEVPAILALVELDIEDHRPETLRRAEGRLMALLADLPENVPAKINLGVVRYALGRPDAAAEAYLEVLEQAPVEPTALINLAQLVLGADCREPNRIERALRTGLTLAPSVQAASAYLALRMDRFDDAARRVTVLAQTRTTPAYEARKLLLSALERYDAQRPDVPWTLGFAAELLATDAEWDAARGLLDVFNSRCKTPACDELSRRVGQLLSKRHVVPTSAP